MVEEEEEEGDFCGKEKMILQEVAKTSLEGINCI